MKTLFLLWAALLVSGHLTLGEAQQCVPTVTLKPNILVAWALQPQPAGVTATGILVERRQGAGAWNNIALLGPTSTSLADRGLAPGTYEYRVSVQGKLTDGSTGSSPYAGLAPGAPPPCVTITQIQPGLNLTVTPAD